MPFFHTVMYFNREPRPTTNHKGRCCCLSFGSRVSPDARRAARSSLPEHPVYPTNKPFTPLIFHPSTYHTFLRLKRYCLLSPYVDLSTHNKNNMSTYKCISFHSHRALTKPIFCCMSKVTLSTTRTASSWHPVIITVLYFYAFATIKIVD